MWSNDSLMGVSLHRITPLYGLRLELASTGFMERPTESNGFDSWNNLPGDCLFCNSQKMALITIKTNIGLLLQGGAASAMELGENCIDIAYSHTISWSCLFHPHPLCTITDGAGGRGGVSKNIMLGASSDPFFFPAELSIKRSCNSAGGTL